MVKERLRKGEACHWLRLGGMPVLEENPVSALSGPLMGNNSPRQIENGNLEKI
jgi:hypothetical protein